jgi:hypothetical protein
MDQVAIFRRRGSSLFRTVFLQWRHAFVMLTLLGAMADSAPAQEQGGRTSPPSEYEVKATFLLNFTKFVQWPSISEPPGTAFNICILGEDPFGETLDHIVQDERVDGRPIQVRRIVTTSSGPCEILFVSATYPNTSAALGEFRTGVLTVGDHDGFIRQGGMIALVVQNRRVRFDVDARSAARSGLKISSRLLNIARSVKDMVR